ncbi:MAG TPA: hypothetical protein PK600_04460 [Deltaproteobacteria bacterium]|nr:hypothetical protein [Deltaproteobacteria bacterium]
MKTKSEHTRVAFTIISFLVLMFSASCGGGGGGGDGDGDGSQILSEYDFALNLDLTNEDQFEIDGNMGEGTGSIFFQGFDGNDYNGTLNLSEENGETSVASIIVDETTVFQIDVSDIWEETNLSIGVTDPIVFENGDDPDSGTFLIDNGGGNLISVSFYILNNDFWVDLQLGDGEIYPYLLDEFKDLLGSDADTWQQQASVAYHMIEMLFDQVNFVAGMIIKIDDDDNASALLGDGVITEGDENAGLDALDESLPGTLTLRCESGSVGPGSDFSVVFDHFWQDDPEDNIDTAIHGSVELLGFLRTEAGNEITSVGFAPFGEDRGGVIYNEAGVAFYETQQDDDGLVIGSLTPTHTIYGSYSLIFSKP